MFNKLVVAALPLVPRPIIRKVSMRYIAGDHLDDAMATARQLWQEEGARATVDVLGEFVESREQALKDKSDSLAVLEAIAAGGMTGHTGLSIKPTSLGLGIDLDFAYDNIKELATRARELGIFMRIDMENTPYTDATLDVYRKLRADGFDRVGLVFQSMLRRTEQDIRDLIEYRPTIRLCKGIYREAAKVAFQDKEEVRDSYRKCLRVMVDNGMYAAIATHDDPLLDDARQLIAERNLSKDDYEFQMLLGVRPPRRRELLAEGHPLRVYVPFGEDWYGYSSRRLKENPEMAGMIAKAVLLGR